MTLIIRKSEETDYPQIADIICSLPEWFDPVAREQSIPIDIQHQECFIAIAEGQAVGFITGFIANGRLNVGWLGVRRDWHRRGVGTLLLAKIEELAKQLAIPEIATYTLGESVDYPPYESTRRFWFRKGFEVYQRNHTDNPGCLEEIHLRKKL